MARMLAKGSENRSRLTAIFGSRFKRVERFGPPVAKIPLAPSGKSVASVCASCSTREAYRDRHGRWRQDAMDVFARSDEACEYGWRRRVVLVPDAGIKLVDDFASDGGNKARFTGESAR